MRKSHLGAAVLSAALLVVLSGCSLFADDRLACGQALQILDRMDEAVATAEAGNVADAVEQIREHAAELDAVNAESDGLKSQIDNLRTTYLAGADILEASIGGPLDDVYSATGGLSTLGTVYEGMCDSVGGL